VDEPFKTVGFSKQFRIGPGVMDSSAIYLADEIAGAHGA
jgi:hypothetical protein